MSEKEHDTDAHFTNEPTVDLPNGRRATITAEITLPTDQAQLLVLAGPDRGRRFEFRDKVIIGRHLTAHVLLKDEGISGRHAAISRTESGEYTLEDLGSRNGTTINGVAVRGRTLALGDKIPLGAGTVLIFTYADPLEEQLLQLQKMEAMGRLAAGVAHEFNNLLSVVLTNLSLLRQTEGLPPSEVEACLDEAREAAGRGAELTRQMLDYSQVSGAELALIDLSALLEELVKLVRPVLDPSVAFAATIVPGLTVHGDRLQLYQVMMNLCLNAKDALGGQGKLSLDARLEELEAGFVATRPSLSPGLHVVITIQDNGVGMDREILERAFEPFFTTKEPGKGTGLGLSMAQGLVSTHGGLIGVHSRGPGAGTCVTVHLPAAEATIDSPPPVRPEITRSLSGTVLVVDDDMLVCKSLGRTLRKLGFEVLVASGGVEALELYREHGSRIQIVLLDVIMPGMGGLEVFQALKQLDPRVRVLISSGYSEEATSEALMEQGALGFLKKPYDIDKLRSEIAAALDLRD